VASYIQKSSVYPTHAAPLIDDSHPLLGGTGTHAIIEVTHLHD
jgi:hypothetical protein